MFAGISEATTAAMRTTAPQSAIYFERAGAFPEHTMDLVMAGLVPAIHVFALGQKFVDARHKAGHDEEPVERPR